jgi:putative hemolysin
MVKSMRKIALAVVLFVLFSGCIQQSGNVYMTYTVSECRDEPVGVSIEKAGDVFYIKQVESYVCCANITLTMNTTGKTIRIYEENTGEMCRCICPFKAEIYLYNATGYENVEIYGIKYRDVYGYELMHNLSLSSPPNQTADEKFCEKDEDCACGVHVKTRECFFGNKKYVDEKTQCPDFCTGIGGNLVIKCEKNTCVQKVREVGIPNPASVFCEEQGGRLDLRTDETGGQYGVCMFENGSECEEWAFYRGECKKGQLECVDDAGCVHIPSCCHPNSMKCIPKSAIKEYPNCEGIACTLECRQCTECVCKNGKCETILSPLEKCC